MSKDKNFQRRMIVSKYNNRPPFELKKPKELYDIEEKLKAYPEETCKSCCKNRSGMIRGVTSSVKPLPISNSELRNQKVDKIIPNILKSFQKLSTQKKESPTMSKNMSIQTLYRNNKLQKLGKNIPKHKLMANLLQNFDFEVGYSQFASTESKVKPLIQENSFNRNQVIKTDFDVNIDTKGKKTNPQSKVTTTKFKDHGKHFDKPRRLDKKTSTSGLIWPLKVESSRYGKSYIPENHFSEKKNPLKSNSFLEEFPTKDTSQSQKCHIDDIKSEKTIKNRKNYSAERIKRHTSGNWKMTDQGISKSSHTTLKSEKINKKRTSCFDQHPSREKTFVQTQVEKLNKVFRGTRIPGPIPHRTGINIRRGGSYESTENHQVDPRSNYIQLMHRVKNSLPQFEDRISSDSGHLWSDTSENELNPERMKFPRETRTAIGKQIGEKRQSLPLSKFTKPHEHFRPAIAPHDHGHYKESTDVYRTDYEKSYDHTKHTAGSKNRSNHLQERHPLVIPCKRNLLCDKGNQHHGPCGYTRNQNKITY